MNCWQLEVSSFGSLADLATFCSTILTDAVAGSQDRLSTTTTVSQFKSFLFALAGYVFRRGDAEQLEFWFL
jgi:hypothetical protein